MPADADLGKKWQKFQQFLKLPTIYHFYNFRVKLELSGLCLSQHLKACVMILTPPPTARYVHSQ